MSRAACLEEGPGRNVVALVVYADHLREAIRDLTLGAEGEAVSVLCWDGSIGESWVDGTGVADSGAMPCFGRVVR